MDSHAHVDRVGRRFWLLTRFILDGKAEFDDGLLVFDLRHPLRESTPVGRYHLISKSHPKTSQIGGDGGVYLYRLSNPLGEYVVEQAKALETPPATIIFDVTHHPARLHAIERVRGKRGYLTLTRILVETYEAEEFLLFSGFDDEGQTLEPEIMEKLFLCSGVIAGSMRIPDPIKLRLNEESKRHTEATVSRSLESNSKHFQQAREKLESWADDLVLAAEKALRDTKEKIKALTREARQAISLAEQHRLQEEIARLEKMKRRQRQEIFQRVHRFLVENLLPLRLPVYLFADYMRFRRELRSCLEPEGRAAILNRWRVNDPFLYARIIRIHTFARVIPLQLIESAEHPEVADEVDEAPNWSAVCREVLQILNERHRTILLKRYGLFGSGQMTLEQIGDEMHVSRERIRQLQKRAEKKLRNRFERLRAVIAPFTATEDGSNEITEE